VVPRLCVAVDLPHLPSLYRFRHEPKRPDRQTLARLLLLQAALRRQPDLAVRLLGECEAAGDFAAHHADWLRRKGVPGCEYLRTPVPDPGPPGKSPDSRRILLIGHLRGTSTLDGLALFAADVLPRLPDDVEVRIAGGWAPPPELARALTRPNVVFLGHLARPDDEFRSAAALVVPTAVPLGARVRILSAFSFGCPVVAHSSNALGIPELADGENSLLGQTGAELAAAALRLVESRELRSRVGAGGRDAYERWFSPPVAARRIEERLVELATSARPGSPPAVARPPIPARP
jgi:glycosyltransferase involved in cell wall biosynthesis